MTKLYGIRVELKVEDTSEHFDLHDTKFPLSSFSVFSPSLRLETNGKAYTCLGIGERKCSVLSQCHYIMEIKASLRLTVV